LAKTWNPRVFEVDRDVMLEGKALPKGKYGLFSIVNGNDWTFVFNKTWKQWGAYKYKEADDVLRVSVKGKTSDVLTEKMTFSISPEGLVSLRWGNMETGFTVK
jgi:hypothetical protein